MTPLHRTVFYGRHTDLGAKMVEFGGWEMPLHYADGIVQEHLTTRRKAGLFDISHMGRFLLRGPQALPFLQHVLSNNAQGLELEESQYTMIPSQTGGVIDDAYLYRFVKDEYLLVVNAANREKDRRHFQSGLELFPGATLIDETRELAMLSLQGPNSKEILSGILTGGRLPEPLRNSLSTAELDDARLLIARTGYTGEPLCFELFVRHKHALKLWDRLVQAGARPVGLGARDTLRLEAGLPLYGHELGHDPQGLEIPMFSSSLARFAVSFSALKGNFVGRQALTRQFKAFKKITDRVYTLIEDLPQITLPLALTGKGVARAGDRVFHGNKAVGFITSGTMVPYWKWEGLGLASRLTQEKGLRAIALALVDSDLIEGDVLEIDIRGRKTAAVVVPYHLRAEAPPYARPILFDQIRDARTGCSKPTPLDPETRQKVQFLVDRAAHNSIWRRQECINLIPSEQTPSAMTRMLSIMDPVCRYAEHKPVKAFSEADVFYYQGTDFIAEVETLLTCELRRYLGCAEVETRLVSGQMANTAVFSAMVDYLNRADRKSEQRRIRRVLNHHMIKGGHLSAQPMGALRDFVVRDPQTEKPAVINFPVLEGNPYQIDVAQCRRIIAEYHPELIIFGKSMMIHKEPVAEIRATVEELSLGCTILYDMAHVLGLAGPHFQEPFKEGADIVSGSTHKTFFGTQRGIVAADWKESDLGYDLWEAIQRRTFPGSVSNHHLGTLLGLLMATYEMNHFKDAYQQNVLANARAFARALKACGLDVAGDPQVSYTQTHQVIVTVGYAKAPEIARRLEDNNIIVNYQAAPQEESFTAAGALRMGVAEMTRFGMAEADFQELAQLIYEVIKGHKLVKDEVSALRKRFLEIQYCFDGNGFDDLLQKLHHLTMS